MSQLVPQCQCYEDTGGFHLCLNCRDRHAHIWEAIETTAGWHSRCIKCGLRAPSTTGEATE